MTTRIRNKYTSVTIPDEDAYPYDDPNPTQQEERRQRLVESRDDVDLMEFFKFVAAIEMRSDSDRARVTEYHLQSILEAYELFDVEASLRAALIWSRWEHFNWWLSFREIVSGKIGDDAATRALIAAIELFENQGFGAEAKRRRAIGALRSAQYTGRADVYAQGQEELLRKRLPELRRHLQRGVFDGRTFRNDARCDIEAAAIPLEAFLKQEIGIEPGSEIAKEFIFDCLSMFDRSVTRTAIANLRTRKSEPTNVLASSDRIKRLAYYRHILATGLAPSV